MRIRIGLLLLFLLWMVSGSTAHALLIGFEEPSPQPPGTAYLIPQYLESGFYFRDPKPIPSAPPYSVGRVGTGLTGRPDNGTSHLSFLIGDSLIFGRSDGGEFSLLSLDLAEYSTVFPVPKLISIFGDRADGTTVSATFTTDGVIDGVGPLVDFETFTLSQEFQNLVQVRIPVDLFSVDHVLVAVPEPGTGTLVLLGLVAVRARRGA